MKSGAGVHAEAAEQLWLHNPGGALGEVLLATAGNGDPDTYASEYAQFEAWVDGSLDAYRVREVYCPCSLRLLFGLIS